MPGDPHTLQLREASRSPNTPANRNRADLDYTGSVMPPPEPSPATTSGPTARRSRSPASTDEDRRTLVRWIDLAARSTWTTTRIEPEATGFGWMLDDQRPTLTLTSPRAGANPPLTHASSSACTTMAGSIWIASGSWRTSRSTASIAGENLAERFRSVSRGIWEFTPDKPVTVANGKITVSVNDRQGNLTRIERTFSAIAAQTR